MSVSIPLEQVEFNDGSRMIGGHSKAKGLDQEFCMGNHPFDNGRCTIDLQMVFSCRVYEEIAALLTRSIPLPGAACSISK
jgi:hypothetical protein